MKIAFHGANREVTGSRHLLLVNGKKILLDCGMYQGKRELERINNTTFGFDPKEVDCVVLSHAHIDHSGALPTLVKQGFKGPIYCTQATKDLCGYMLKDSGFIQEREAEYLNKKYCEKGLPKVEAIYTMEDAENCLELFKGVDFHKPFEVTKGVYATMKIAGHILGAAQVFLEIEDQETKKDVRFLFSGDLGRHDVPIIPDPEQVKEADFLLIESTYGNRVHETFYNAGKRIAEVINKVAKRGGRIIIPSFALGRSQELVYTLHKLLDEAEIPPIPIYVDSPLTLNVTAVFKNHQECFDKETFDEFLKDNDDPFGFSKLKYVSTVEESKSLNDVHGPHIIISASGMAEHGRILHHLKNNIDQSLNAVLFVGYQAMNTLGRKLVDGNKIVNILGKTCRVRAEIFTFDAFSAHADRSDLLTYADGVKKVKKIMLVHGEEEPMFSFKEALHENGYDNVEMPVKGGVMHLE